MFASPTALAEAAERNRHIGPPVVIDPQETRVNGGRDSMGSDLSHDGVHPLKEGYLIMDRLAAPAVKAALDLTRR